MPLPLSFPRRRSTLTMAIRHNDADKIASILSNRTQPPTARHLTSAITNASYSALQTLLHTFRSAISHHSTALTTTSPPHHPLIPALHAAAAALDPVSISILLSSDASPRAVQNGLEPIHIAIRKKPKTPSEKHALMLVITTLVSAGALEGHFEDDLYPPNYAVAHRNHHALSALLSHSSEHLSKSLQKYCTIRYVCTHASIHALSIVIPHINVTQPDTYGSTPLHHAVSSPHAPESTVLTMVRLIIRAGCPVGRRDMYGRTPFQIAQRRGMERVVHLLGASGASDETFAQVLLRRARRDSKNNAAIIMRTVKVVNPRTGKCSICLDALPSKRAVETSCGHIYHSECLSDWVLAKATCPLCKRRLP